MYSQRLTFPHFMTFSIVMALQTSDIGYDVYLINLIRREFHGFPEAFFDDDATELVSGNGGERSINSANWRSLRAHDVHVLTSHCRRESGGFILKFQLVDIR